MVKALNILFILIIFTSMSPQAFGYQSDILSDTVQFYSTAPRFSEDGNSVTFYSYRESEFGADLYSVKIDDKTTSRISKTERNEWWFDYTSGDKLLISSDVFKKEPYDGSDITLFDPSDQSFVQLSKSNEVGVFNIYPRVSRDNSKIVYCHDCMKPVSNSDIYIMDIDGSNPKPIAQTDFDERKPVWSPDGSKILFSSNRDGKFALYEYFFDTGETKKINDLNNELDIVEGEYSPNGNFIVYVAKISKKQSELHLLDIRKGTTRKLTSGEFLDVLPVWSPDGTKIPYST